MSCPSSFPTGSKPRSPSTPAPCWASPWCQSCISTGRRRWGSSSARAVPRAFVIVSRINQRDYLAELATIRDGLNDLEHVIVVGETDDPSHHHFEDLRSADPIEGPIHVDPDTPALIGYTSGTTADPKGVVHTHRTLGCEVRQLAGNQANRDRPGLVGAPVGHAIGMLGGLLCPIVAGKPIFMIDGWDPPTVLAAMLEEQIAAGSGSTYFFTSLLDHPDCGPEHIELMHFIGLGGSPIPDAVAERADDLGISLVRSYGSTEHPSVTGSEHEAPPREADPHRRLPHALGRGAHRRRGRKGHRRRRRRRDPRPRPRPLRWLHGSCADRRVHRRRRLVPHRRCRRSRCRRVPHHH